MRQYLNERIIVGVALFAAPLILIALSVGAEFAELGGAFSPLFFPVTVLWFWAGIAAVSLAVDLRRAGLVLRSKGPDGKGLGGMAPGSVSPKAWIQILLVTLAMAGFVFAVTRLGFLLSAMAFVAVVLLVLGIRGPALVLGYSIALPLAIFLLFHHGLGLPLPTSPFSYLF